MQLFFYIFSSLMILSASGVVTSKNPVYAVLWLIFTFLNGAAIFILLGAEFISLTIVIVYVGAVAVLFLFVVMMLNISFEQVKTSFFSNRILSILIMGMVIVDLVLLIKASVSSGYVIHKIWNPYPAGLTNTHAIGTILYTKYFLAFQLCGLILLVAMVGSIVLTLRKRDGVKRQKHIEQLMRSEDSVKLVQVKFNEGVDEITYK